MDWQDQRSKTKPLNKLSSKDIQEHIKSITNVHRKRQAKFAIKSYYENELNTNHINFKQVKIPKIQYNKKQDALSTEEVKMLVDHTSSKKFKLIIRFLYSTGLRVGEMIHVLAQDIHLEQQEVFVRKGKHDKTRTTIVYNDPTLLKDLKLYLEERRKKGIHKDYLFLNSRKE